MKTYFINTDARSNQGRSLHSEWLRRGLAVTSGSTDYRDALATPNVGDRLLMYANREGVVAVGRVEDAQVRDVTDNGKVSLSEAVEYHRRVSWKDLTSTPVAPRDLEKLLFIPRGAVTPVASDNPKLDAFLSYVDRQLAKTQSDAGRFTPDRAVAVLVGLKRTLQIEELPEKQRSQQFHFGGPRARSMVVSKDVHEQWVRVYINRQSRSHEWFPIESPERHFAGVDVGYRYVRGHTGLKGQPGIATSVAKISTLNPLDNHVLMLHCSDERGFRDLAHWYAGHLSLGSGQPPSSEESSGEGPWSSITPASPIQEIDEEGEGTTGEDQRTMETHARNALRVLVAHVLRQQDVLKPITYPELATQIGRLKRSGEPFCLGLGAILGHATELVARASTKDSGRPPFLAAVVVKSRGANAGVPGTGVGSIWPGYENLTFEEKKAKALVEYDRILAFGSRWNDVLRAVGVEPVDGASNENEDSSAQGRTGWGGGESEQHKRLKRYVASHPELFGIDIGVETQTVEEYALRSADEIDVFFKSPRVWTGIEVKSVVSDGLDSDYQRGLYQVVKYEALLRAQAKIDHPTAPPEVRVLLVLERSLPDKYRNEARALGIEVRENVQPTEV